MTDLDLALGSLIFLWIAVAILGWWVSLLEREVASFLRFRARAPGEDPPRRLIKIPEGSAATVPSTRCPCEGPPRRLGLVQPDGRTTSPAEMDRHGCDR